MEIEIKTVITNNNRKKKGCKKGGKCLSLSSHKNIRLQSSFFYFIQTPVPFFLFLLLFDTLTLFCFHKFEPVHHDKQ
jgi:hypothetical protein